MIVNEIKKRAAGLFNKKRTQLPAGSSFKRSAQTITINKRIRLVRFDGLRNESISWYQDKQSMRNIVGKATSYTKAQIVELYNWQNKNGELYYIEYLENKKYQTIGDVWLAKNDYAIVIDKAYRNRRIGRVVTKYFIYRSKIMGRKMMVVGEIFNWNKASQKMFTSLKFYPFKENKDSWSYRKIIIPNTAEKKVIPADKTRTYSKAAGKTAS